MSNVVEIEGGRIQIALKIGVSAISKQIVADINQACSQAEDLGTRAIIKVTLAARAPDTPDSSGSDRVDLQLLSQWERALARLENAPGLVLACVEENCVGTMLELLRHPGLVDTAPPLAGGDFYLAPGSTRRTSGRVRPLRPTRIGRVTALFRASHRRFGCAMSKRRQSASFRSVTHRCALHEAVGQDVSR